MATGGSVESVSLRGRIFSVPADADIQRKLGGFENEVQMNGDGSARIVKTRIPSMIGGLQVTIDDTRGDEEYLTELKNGRDFFPFSITYASGVTYAGQVMIVGEVTTASQNTTATMDLNGPGFLSRV